MAVITSFLREERDRIQLHKTQVECKYISFERDGYRILQLNTYGSDNRQIPGKVSQTLQITQETAPILLDILKREFKL